MSSEDLGLLVFASPVAVWFVWSLWNVLRGHAEKHGMYGGTLPHSTAGIEAKQRMVRDLAKDRERNRKGQ